MVVLIYMIVCVKPSFELHHLFVEKVIFLLVCIVKGWLLLDGILFGQMVFVVE
jgi:hypothetical protein